MNPFRQPFCYRGEEIGGSVLVCDRLAATRCHLLDSNVGGGGKKASQTTQTASGDGKNLAEKSTLVESGSIGVTGKGARYQEAGAWSWDKLKLGKNASLTVNMGLGTEALESLTGNLTKATSDQLAAFAASNSDQISALTDASKKQSDQFKDLLTQKADNTAGNPKLISGVAIAAVIGFAAVLFAIFSD